MKLSHRGYQNLDKNEQFIIFFINTKRKPFKRMNAIRACGKRPLVVAYQKTADHNSTGAVGRGRRM